ncbi:GntR family transcriptional regulator [Microbacterium faecale]|uniref:GntR family transcriptional regulator n=1 Tax=Microbacterium faecale TaxID=1804630 RepID=A0A916Y314_9MICO|nr:GntR family transcriptional regulator [Microbacterium faecale]GGD28238.1 GntR family transcriptional regulator [Microbacterium faecale]
MTDTVYDRIRAAIVSGELSAAQRLAEVALAERFGTSRTPVREALQQLESERLIERTRRGRFVRQIQPEEVFDIYDVLKVLEASAARMASERATAWNLLQLRTVHQSMVDLTEPNAPRRAELNREFHEVLAAAAHSPTTARVLLQLNSSLIVTARTTLAVEERWQAALAEHEELVDAIARRDGDAAARIAEEHMVAARDVRVQFYSDTAASLGAR